MIMERIDNIKDFSNRCTGCMACIDVCPAKCIYSEKEDDGFIYPVIDEIKCVMCGKCYSVCPMENSEKHNNKQHMFAAYQVDSVSRNRGSSGGIFELLAEYCLKHGYYVCGAAFEETTLKHCIINKQEELLPLLKSKYIQSNTEGIYNKLLMLIKQGEKVFFCGTPCQVSAFINSVPVELRHNILAADIICHGVPSQAMFDGYIKTLENKHQGKVTEFCFRVKDNHYHHPHGFTYKVEKNGVSHIYNGIYSNSSFYNAFKSYSIFRNGCYNCEYATLQRVSDITLADFWGIEKYDFKKDTQNGVSMVITNTPKGFEIFEYIGEKIVCKEFPLQCGIESNHCLTHRTVKPAKRDEVIHSFASLGYEKTAKTYFKCSAIHRLWWCLPSGFVIF